MRIAFAQVDAFADRPFTGNPAAVMPLDAWLDDATLQAIAAENNLAETAFLVRASDAAADYDLRWFTPTIEIALCGHATLASGHVLMARDDGDRLRFRTRKSGLLEVRRAGDGYELDLPAWESQLKAMPEIAARIGGAPEAMLWNDGGYSIFAFATEDEVCALQPDFRALGGLGDILYMATAPGRATDIVARVFAPGAGIDEDPVTGSAYSLLTPYWARRLGRDSFSAYQASARGGHVACRLAGDRVILGGRCVTMVEGEFLL